MATRRRFEAKLVETDRGGGGHLVEVPGDVVKALGGKGRIPVNATFNGIPYRGSIVRMGGASVLGVLKSIVQELGVELGHTLDVTVALHTAERTVDVPPDLVGALSKDPGLKAAWDGLSFTRRKELARAIDEAKRPETRARRLDRALEELRSLTRSPAS